MDWLVSVLHLTYHQEQKRNLWKVALFWEDFLCLLKKSNKYFYLKTSSFLKIYVFCSFVVDHSRNFKKFNSHRNYKSGFSQNNEWQSVCVFFLFPFSVSSFSGNLRSDPANPILPAHLFWTMHFLNCLFK